MRPFAPYSLRCCTTDLRNRLATEYKWPFALAYPFYVLSFIGFALQVMDRLSSHCVKLGTFDEKQIGRDRTPDKSVKHLAYGVTGTSCLVQAPSASSC